MILCFLERRQSSLSTFQGVGDATVTKYSGVLTELLFGVMRSTVGLMDKYKFPVTEEQTHSLGALHNALLCQGDASVVDKCVQDATCSLFSHIKQNVLADKYFSPVNCFLVLSSLKMDGNFKKASEITQTIAALVYANRTAQLNEMYNVAVREKITMTL